MGLECVGRHFRVVCKPKPKYSDIFLERVFQGDGVGHSRCAAVSTIGNRLAPEHPSCFDHAIVGGWDDSHKAEITASNRLYTGGSPPHTDGHSVFANTSVVSTFAHA